MSSSLSKPVAPPTSRPAPNPNVPQIPTPQANVGALAVCVQFLKQAVDNLAGYRGKPTNRAVTFDDLVSLGIASTTVVQSVNGTVPASGGSDSNTNGLTRAQALAIVYWGL